MEGLPAIACVFLTRLLLPSKPSETRFLSAEEKAWIRGQLEREERQKRHAQFTCGAQTLSVAQTLAHPRVWHLALIGFSHGFATYTFSFWLPQMMKLASGERSNTMAGLLVMIPNVAGLIAMLAVSRHSDRTLERRWHMAASSVFAGIALLLLGASRSLSSSMILFSAVAIGAYSTVPVLMSTPGEFLTGVSAAAGIALVTSLANLGGFAGPYIVGVIRQKTGNLHYGLLCAGVSFLFSASLSAQLRKRGGLAPNQASGAADIAFEWGD
jgi:ACS family tartrate transporter-like MFS transporter